MGFSSEAKSKIDLSIQDYIIESQAMSCFYFDLIISLFLINTTSLIEAWG